MSKILWVEDEKASFNAFSFMLERQYQITRAVDYTDAMLKVRAAHFDLIVVDIIIPSGYKNITLEELLKQTETYFGVNFIKEVRKENKKTPMIVLTIVRTQSILNEIKEIDNTIVIVWKYDSDAEKFKSIIDNLLANKSKK